MYFPKNIQSFIRKRKLKYQPILYGLVFASLFSVVFYVVANNTHYLPIKFSAALPFLVADQTSDTSSMGDGVLDDIVVDDTPIEEDLIRENPMNYPSRLVALDNKIKEAGIPIDGVALLNRDTHEVRIDFSLTATEDQKIKAREIADSFDWKLTYKDIFNSQKAKEEIMQQYPVEKLVVLSPYMQMINYFLDQKNFSKLKGFMNGLFLQNIITQDDYMVFANILNDQKIYFNLVFDKNPVNADSPPAQDQVVEPSVVAPSELPGEADQSIKAPEDPNPPADTTESPSDPIEEPVAPPEPIEPAVAPDPIESTPVVGDPPQATETQQQPPIIETPTASEPENLSSLPTEPEASQ